MLLTAPCRALSCFNPGFAVSAQDRFLRVMTYGNLVYLGYLARENPLANATGWPTPMRIPTTIQCVLVTFYQAATLGSTDVQFVPAAGDKKKK